MKTLPYIKKITLINLLLVFAACNLSAQLLVENFEYPLNTTLSTASTGWSVASSPGTAPIDVITGLSFDGYAGSAIGGAANIDNNGEDIYKLFTAQTTGIVYAAFIIQTKAANAASYFFALTSNPFSTSSYACKIYVNASGNGVGIGTSTPATYQPITPETPTLVVIKYDIDSKISSLFVLNSFLATEPASPNATITETASSNVGGILLRQYNANQRIIVDGIRVGNTWSEAVAQGCMDAGLSFGITSLKKTVGDAPFTQPATSLNPTAAITYSSSAPLVAAVNASTGEITLGEAGMAKITATQNSGTYNSIAYCSASTSYTINVGSAPSLTVTEVLFPTLTTNVGTATTETINVSGINLTNNINIALTGTNAELFSISTNSILQQGGIGPNTVVTVTYLPTSQGMHTATLILSSTGTDTISQVLNGIGNTGTGDKNTIQDKYLTVINGNLVFRAKSGDRVDIFNTIGQKIKSINTIDGINTVSINTKGVLIVKIGNSLSKILL